MPGLDTNRAHTGAKTSICTLVVAMTLLSAGMLSRAYGDLVGSATLPTVSHAKAPGSTCPVSAKQPTAKMIGESGEEAYDGALQGQWDKVGRCAKHLALLTARLPWNYVNWREQFGLQRSVCGLQLAVAARDQWGAAREANRVTLYAARLGRHTHTPTLSKILLLDVYGRDLQVGGARGDEEAMCKALGRLDAAWVQIRPRIVQASGKGDETRFDDLMKTARAENSAPRLYVLARLLLLEAKHLEQAALP